VSEKNKIAIRLESYDYASLDTMVKRILAVLSGSFRDVSVAYLPTKTKTAEIKSSPFVYSTATQKISLDVRRVLIYIFLVKDKLNELKSKLSTVSLLNTVHLKLSGEQSVAQPQKRGIFGPLSKKPVRQTNQSSSQSTADKRKLIPTK